MTTAEQEQASQAAWDQARIEGVDRAQAAIAAGLDATYTAQPGDTFESIAEAIYGDAEAGVELHVANGALIGSTATALAPGHVLTIPYRAAAPAEAEDVDDGVGDELVDGDEDADPATPEGGASPAGRG